MRRKSKRRERLDIDLKLNLKILHPLTLKVDETLSIYKHKVYNVIYVRCILKIRI